MLFQELIALLPEDAPPRAVAFGVAAAVVGGALWACGARYSRYVIPLFAVAIGGVVGMQLPHWLGWSIGGSGTAVGAAVVLGVSAFVLHGMWTGLGLGITCAFWVTVVSWICTRDGHTWDWPAVVDGTTLASYSQLLWQSLPDAMTRILPFGAAASLITGLAMAIMWPRLTLALMWSLTGLTLALVGGLVAATYANPDLLHRVPSSQNAQIGILFALLGAGAAIQWRIAPAARSKRSGPATPAPSAKPATT